MWDEERRYGKSADTLAGEIDAIWFIVKEIVGRMPPADISSLVEWTAALCDGAERRAVAEDTDAARDYRDGIHLRCDLLEGAMRPILDDAGISRWGAD